MLADFAMREDGETKDLSTILEENDAEAAFVGTLPRNAKLTDEEIEQMRILRADYGLEWELLAEMFKVNDKTCYRICTGMSRPNCKGPLEPLINPQPMLETVRCRTCGGKHEKGKVCNLCQCKWVIHITHFLKRAGYIRKTDF